MSVGRVGTAFRYFFSVKTGSGAARTGLASGAFSVLVRDPTNTNTMAAPTVVEVGSGMYFFDISGAFTTTNGAGEYGITVAVITAPVDLFGDSVAFFVSTFDDLATAAALALVQADTDDIQTRLPAALVGGRIDASVGAVAAGAITAAGFATDAIDANALAADAAAEIGAAVDVVLSLAHGAGSWATSALTTGAIATAVWGEALPGAFGPGTAGLILGTNLDVVLSTRAAPGDAMALTVAERTATATEVDVVLTAAHGAGSWVGAGLTPTQDTALIETWQQLGNDVANRAKHKDATTGVPGYIRVPADGSLINITVTKVAADEVELERQP